jgi:hypothetical protein
MQFFGTMKPLIKLNCDGDLRRLRIINDEGGLNMSAFELRDSSAGCR